MMHSVPKLKCPRDKFGVNCPLDCPPLHLCQRKIVGVQVPKSAYCIGNTSLIPSDKEKQSGQLTFNFFG